MTDAAVHVSITDGVALLQMRRPMSRNAFSDDMNAILRATIGTRHGPLDGLRAQAASFRRAAI
jgi:enoyl-CoA hydratase/carnithine racemase